MKTIINIPYNIIELEKGSIGLDAYFWEALSTPCRRTILIRPASELEGSPAPSAVVLQPRVKYTRQLADLTEVAEQVKHERLRWAAKLQRWKLARFFLIPLPSRIGYEDSLGELVFAERIAENILEQVRGYRGVGWLTMEWDEGNRITRCGSPDRVYQWLLEHDEGFKRSIGDISTRT